jgi:GTP-binding protein Era
LTNPKGHAANDTRAIVEALKADQRTAALAFNKIDGVKRTDLLPLVQQLSQMFAFEKVFLISALKGDGIGDVRDWVASRMPEGPWLYPAEQAADIPSRLLAAEITREKIYLRLHDELPYACAVESEKWEDRKDGSVKIEQTIYVQREGQKAIVLGKGGATIKLIGEMARKELEELFQRRVHLFLFVKVQEDWAEQREHYRAMGLDYPEA